MILLRNTFFLDSWSVYSCLFMLAAKKNLGYFLLSKIRSPNGSHKFYIVEFHTLLKRTKDIWNLDRSWKMVIVCSFWPTYAIKTTFHLLHLIPVYMAEWVIKSHACHLTGAGVWSDNLKLSFHSSFISRVVVVWGKPQICEEHWSCIPDKMEFIHLWPAILVFGWHGAKLIII